MVTCLQDKQSLMKNLAQRAGLSMPAGHNPGPAVHQQPPNTSFCKRSLFCFFFQVGIHSPSKKRRYSNPEKRTTFAFLFLSTFFFRQMGIDFLSDTFLNRISEFVETRNYALKTV